jgi:pimeloyl-ACP methyl ester carboxylesterase
MRVPGSSSTRTRVTRLAVALALALALCTVTAASAGARSQAPARPTIVLVHGAFADASSWGAVVPRLLHAGYPVLAPANPLRGVGADATYLRRVLARIKGPIVLVGHSYGGVVITNAATGNRQVKALVYVAAFAPDQGESVQELGALVPGGMIGPATLDIEPYPLPDGTDGLEGTIKPDVFRTVFAADLPARQVKTMAVSQRPASLFTLGEETGVPAWRTIPSWYLLPGSDNAIGTKLERFMAQRMGATTVVAPGASHVVMLSRPQQTTQLILAAAATVH